MTLIPPLAAQAAVEYGATTGMAGEIANSMQGFTNSARHTVQVVAANPVILVLGLLVLLLLFVFFRNPAR